MSSESKSHETSSPSNSHGEISQEATDESRDPQAPFKSYLEYIRAIESHNNSFDWVRNHLEYRLSETSGLLNVLECIDGKIIPIENPDRQALQNPTEGVRTRIIMLCDGIDGGILDDLSYALDLDPVLLWRILDNQVTHVRRPFEDMSSAQARFLSSRRDCLEFKLNTFSRVFALFVRQPKIPCCTNIVIFCRSINELAQFVDPNQRFSISQASEIESKSARRTIGHHYLTIIQQWTSEEVHFAEERLVEFLPPLLRLLIYEEISWTERCKELINKSCFSALHEEDPFLFRNHSFFGECLLHLKNSLQRLENFIAAQVGEPSQEWVNLISGFRGIIEEMTMQLEIVKDLLNQQVALLAYEESRKSIQMADSLKNLSQLAFIFVPLTFATSIFGANLAVTGSGTVPIWAFLVTLLAICLASVFIWYFISIGWRQPLRGIKNFAVGFALFALRSPSGALVLLSQSLFHQDYDISYMLCALGLFLRGKRYNRSEIVKRAKKECPPGDTFWKDRLHRVAVFVSQENWESNYFHRRVFAKVKSVSKLLTAKTKSESASEEGGRV